LIPILSSLTRHTVLHVLSLHDALPISGSPAPLNENLPSASVAAMSSAPVFRWRRITVAPATEAFAESSTLPPTDGNCAKPGTTEIGRHTSELQSLRHLVCRLLPETKNT